MSVTFWLAIYFVIWWIVLFAVLPFGVRTQGEAGDVVPGTPESAPAAPRMLRTFAITTAVAAVVFGITYAMIVHDVAGIGAWIVEGVPNDKPPGQPR
jgi:predicted secreted protein